MKTARLATGMLIVLSALVAAPLIAPPAAALFPAPPLFWSPCGNHSHSPVEAYGSCVDAVSEILDG